MEGSPGSKGTRYDYLFKVILIGDPCCGKSSLMLRYAQNKDPTDYATTVGVDFKVKKVHFEDKIVKLQLWDTAGQERFKHITTSYYRGAHCCVILFDITNQDSFHHLYNWIEQFYYYNDQEVQNIVLVGNKHDLED